MDIVIYILLIAIAVFAVVEVVGLVRQIIKRRKAKQVEVKDDGAHDKD